DYLSKRQREILIERFWMDKTLQDVSETYEISMARVWSLEKRGIEILRKAEISGQLKELYEK
ncbi:hypothetical protein KKE38_05460, partial [Candidatus Micrarchaeota archaeon]|nr:hypothetical protein [Candidatus Micrarchaeota archaeon]